MVDEHADFKIDPTFPSPFYVGDSVKAGKNSVLAGGSIPIMIISWGTSVCLHCPETKQQRASLIRGDEQTDSRFQQDGMASIEVVRLSD